MKRFWKNVNKTEICWNWTGLLNRNGYGRFYFQKKHCQAHRFSWELHNDLIPKGEGYQCP